MADTKISALTAASTPLAGTEVLPIVQSSTTKKVAVSDLTAGRSVSAISFVPTGSTIPANGLYLPATNSIGIATNSTNAAYIDSSGNVGVGVTPSAWVDYKAMQLPGSSFIGYTDGASNNQAQIVANAYFASGSSWKYINTDNASKYMQYDGEHRFYTAPSGTAGNTITFTQALTLNANGALALQGGVTTANGIGITFPATQSASTDANTLDDYEEGTWTPAFQGESTAGTATYGRQIGYYVKIGRQVTVTCSCQSSDFTGTGNLLVTGLPFTTLNVSSWTSPGNVIFNSTDLPANTVSLSASSANNVTTVRFFSTLDNAGFQRVQCGSAVDLYFSFTYFV